jgi:hypothetical protein
MPLGSWGIGIFEVTLSAANIDNTVLKPLLDMFKYAVTVEKTHMETSAKIPRDEEAENMLMVSCA